MGMTLCWAGQLTGPVVQPNWTPGEGRQAQGRWHVGLEGDRVSRVPWPPPHLDLRSQAAAAWGGAECTPFWAAAPSHRIVRIPVAWDLVLQRVLRPKRPPSQALLPCWPGYRTLFGAEELCPSFFVPLDLLPFCTPNTYQQRLSTLKPQPRYPGSYLVIKPRFPRQVKELFASTVRYECSYVPLRCH